MKSIYKIVIVSVVIVLSLHVSVFSKNKLDKFAEEYAKNLIEIMKVYDTLKLKQLTATADELSQYIKSMSQEEQNSINEMYPDLEESSQMTYKSLKYNFKGMKLSLLLMQM